MPPPQYKIYHLVQIKLAELKKQIIKLLKKTKFRYLIVLMGPPSFLLKRMMDDYIYVLIIML